jgi:hypothetical protein
MTVGLIILAFVIGLLVGVGLTIHAWLTRVPPNLL